MIPVAMISGHLDITPDEWNEHYAQRVSDAINAGHSFVVGDARGCDSLAQSILYRHNKNLLTDLYAVKVTVFHMFAFPRNLSSMKFHTVGGFQSDEERDAAMTAASDYDIAWVREGREKSGTAKNIERRKLKEQMLPSTAFVDLLVDELSKVEDIDAFSEAEKRLLKSIVGNLE